MSLPNRRICARGTEVENRHMGQVILEPFSPLTPVPLVTGGDERWPFFHFWRHQFWPKSASSILNFCRRKRSFQWCPDQSDRPSGAWDMHRNAEKVELKTRSKISRHYTQLFHGKNCPSRRRFLRIFLTASKPSRRPISAAAKRKEKEKKERLSKFWFLLTPKPKCRKTRYSWQEGQDVVLQMLFDQIKANLADIPAAWKPPNCPKTHFWQKAPGVNGSSSSLSCSEVENLRQKQLRAMIIDGSPLRLTLCNIWTCC